MTAVSDLDEIGRCGHCGHAVLESHRPIGSSLAQCPGCGAEVAVGKVLRLEALTRAERSSEPRAENPWREVPGQSWPRTTSLDAPVAPGPAPLGYEVARDDDGLELTLPDPSPRSAGRLLATAVGSGLLLANFASVFDSTRIALAVLGMGMAAVFFVMRNRPVAFSLQRDVLTVRQKERTLVVRGVAHVAAQEDGLRARLVAELHDGGTRDLLTGLERLGDARWVAGHLNLALPPRAPVAQAADERSTAPAARQPAD